MSFSYEIDSLITLMERFLQKKRMRSVDMLSQFGSVQPSHNLAPSIMEQLEETPSFFRRYTPALAIAAACLLIVTALLLPEKNTEHTISAAVVHSPPKSRTLQLPQKLSNTLIEQEMDVTSIALVDEDIEKETPSPQKTSPKRRKRTVAKRIQPLVLDQPTSREESPYLLFMNDPEILYKLDSLAKANNSILTQRDGSSLSPYAMSDGKSTQVLKMSADAGNINAIEKALRQLGADFHQFSSPNSDENIQLQINIQFE